MSRFAARAFVGLFLMCLILSTLAGCSEQSVPDQCMRRQIFKECMAALPVGPSATVNNDWSEVVSECQDTAYYQSIRKPSQIKQECRP